MIDFVSKLFGSDLSRKQVVVGMVYGVKVSFELDPTEKYGHVPRVKLAVSPYPILEGGIARIIFARAGQVLSDPSGIEPSRPPGHCYEDHMSGTERWNPKDEPEVEERIFEFAQFSPDMWGFLYSDGGSSYYALKENPKVRKQVAIVSGRTMIGIQFEVNWNARFDSLGLTLPIVTLLQKRMVTDVGTDTKRSPLWTPQYAFGGWINPA